MLDTVLDPSSANLGHPGWKSEESGSQLWISLPHWEAAQVVDVEEWRQFQVQLLHLGSLLQEVQFETGSKYT